MYSGGGREGVTEKATSWMGSEEKGMGWEVEGRGEEEEQQQQQQQQHEEDKEDKVDGRVFSIKFLLKATSLVPPPQILNHGPQGQVNR